MTKTASDHWKLGSGSKDYDLNPDSPTYWLWEVTNIFKTQFPHL